MKLMRLYIIEIEFLDKKEIFNIQNIYLINIQ